MKKAVILHPSFWKQAMGGAELQISYLVQQLLAKGVEVHYIYEDKGISIGDEQEIHLHPLKKINLKKRFGSRWFLYRKRINKQLDQIKPDVIYTRFFSSWSGIASVYAKKHAIRHIWALASDNDLRALDKPVSLLKPLNIFERQYVKKAFQMAAAILTQNGYQQKALHDKYNRTGVLISQSAELCDASLIKKEGTAITVVWIANLKTLKRPELFIDIAKELAASGNITFKMIGRNNASYVKLIREAEEALPRFKYLGELKNTEVNEVLCSADILVNTSDYEGFSNTFVQAWMRKVVVISMNSNPDDILTKQGIGFICPEVKEAASKIRELADHPALITAMGEKAFGYAREHHSVEKNLQKILNLMDI